MQPLQDCAEAGNAKFRIKREQIGHTAERCVRQYEHVAPALSTWVTAMLDFDEQRALSRAEATNDETVFAKFTSNLLGPGRVGDRQMEAEDARLKKEV
jgi:hypothetical protein